MILRNEAAHGFGSDVAAAQVVVVLVEVIAAGVRSVGFPVVGGPAIAARAVEGEARRWIGVAEVEIQAVNVRRDGARLCGIDGDGDIGSRGACGRRTDLRGVCTFAKGFL